MLSLGEWYCGVYPCHSLPVDVINDDSFSFSARLCAESTTQHLSMSCTRTQLTDNHVTRCECIIIISLKGVIFFSIQIYLYAVRHLPA